MPPPRAPCFRVDKKNLRSLPFFWAGELKNIAFRDFVPISPVFSFPPLSFFLVRDRKQMTGSSLKKTRQAQRGTAVLAGAAALALLLFLVWPVATAKAQSGNLAEKVRRAGETYGLYYTEPLVEGGSAGIGSNLFWKARLQAPGYDAQIKKISVSLGLRYTRVPIDAGERDFTLPSGADVFGGNVEELSYEGFGRAGLPTAFGAESGPEPVVVLVDTDPGDGEAGGSGPSAYTFRPPGGTFGKENAFPVATIQGGLGVTSLGLHFSGRYTPPSDRPGYGHVRLYGAGARWSLSSVAPGLPFGFGFYGYYQNAAFRAEGGADAVGAIDVFSGGALFTERLAGSSFAGLDLSVLVGAEKGSATFNYEQRAGTESGDPRTFNIAFEYKEPILFRGRAGLSLALGPAVLHAGYAAFPREALVLSAGLSL